MSTLATTKKTSRASTAKPGRYKTGQMDIYFLGSNLASLADNLLHLIKKFRIVIFFLPRSHNCNWGPDYFLEQR